MNGEQSDKSDSPTRVLSRSEQRKFAKEQFVTFLREDPTVSLACERINVSRDTIYKWRKSDKVFAQAWDDAIERTRDVARSSIYRRGILGWEETVVSMGQVVYLYEPVVDEEGNQRFDHRDKPLMKGGKPLVQRKYSDTLAMGYARANLPEYKEKPQLNVHAQLADLAEQRKQKVLAELEAAITNEDKESPHTEEKLWPS